MSIEQDKSHRYDRGYKTGLTKEQSLTFRRKFATKSVTFASLITAIYIASIYIATATLYTSIKLELPLWGLSIFFALLTLFITRQMRALESVVHFGSHYNFSNDKKKNDLLVNILSAWPVLSDVSTYRAFHSKHHGDFGSESDPCRQRFERMGLPNIDISTPWKLSLAVVRWLPGYTREYYADVGSKLSQILTFLAWHIVASFACTLVISVEYAIISIIMWVLCMFVMLPVVRSIAEVSEHDYELGKTEYSTTFNNIGLIDRLFLHPAGDAWHILHHLHPAIPWWNQRAAHRFLMTYDRTYRNGLHRTSLFENQKVAEERVDAIA